MCKSASDSGNEIDITICTLLLGTRMASVQINLQFFRWHGTKCSLVALSYAPLVDRVIRVLFFM